jgi:hypothetical protein
MPMPTLAKFRKISDDELTEIFDELVPNYPFTPNDILDELTRRESSKQTDVMRRYTLCIVLMTGIVTLATLLNLVVAYLLYRKP